LEALTGVLLGVFLAALAEWVQKRSRLSYGRSLALVVVALSLLTVGLGWFLSARLANQMGQLLARLPESFKQAQEYLGQSTWGRFLLEQAPQPGATRDWTTVLRTGTGLITSLTELFEVIIVVLVVGLFGAAEPDVYKAGALHLVPPRHRRRLTE